VFFNISKIARKNKEKFKANSLANHLVTGSDKNLWQEIKRTSRSTMPLPNNVDGHVGE
jgi:hypothetical protein